MSGENTVVCPHCGQLDAAGRVASVYENARASASSSSLAKRLAPPPKPFYNFIEAGWQEHKTNSSGCSEVFARLFISLFMAALLGAISVGLFYGVFATAKIEFKDMVLPVAGVGLLLFFLSSGEEGNHAQVITGDDLKTSWEKAMHRWRTLYYCSRCDVVFFPGQRQFLPGRQMRSYLYKKII